MKHTGLSVFLQQQIEDQSLIRVLEALARSCVRISTSLRQGALADVLGALESENVQGETQKKLDVLSNDVLLHELAACGAVAAMASEEMEDPVLAAGKAPYLVVFDPLDGSSNIDVNVSVGTIFSVLLAPKANELTDPGIWLQPGRTQVAAGYALYGPSTQLILSVGQGVHQFSLDPLTCQFVLTQERMHVPEATAEFAINMSNQRFWERPVQQYVTELLQGKEGPRAKNYNMRWVASMVADVHRILTRGGVFLYPLDERILSQGGKLRLMYEANPMGWLVEQAGGRVSTGHGCILDLRPEKLHQRVPVMLGAAEEVRYLEALHKAQA